MLMVIGVLKMVNGVVVELVKVLFPKKLMILQVPPKKLTILTIVVLLNTLVKV